jgi:NDP-sugar pyrophosphorylase family protein
MTTSEQSPDPAERTNRLSLVVLAAGIGSRYGGLKQLESVGPGGETLLEYSVFDALRAGFNHIVLVIRPETEDQFRKSLGSRLPNDVDVSYVFQGISDLPDGASPPTRRTNPWGTAHAVLAAEPTISGPFVVINADDFYGRDAFRILADFMNIDRQGGPPTFALAGFEVGPTLSDAGPVSRGLCRASETGWLEKIAEVPKLTKNNGGGGYCDASGIECLVSFDALVSMNMWGFTPEIFPELRLRFQRFLDDHGIAADSRQEFLIPDVVQGMIADKSARVRVLRHKGRWCGITFPEDRLPARAFIAELVEQGEYPSRLWKR